MILVNAFYCNLVLHLSMKSYTKVVNFPIFGIILVLLGITFLLNNYGITFIDIGKIWPIFLILLGGGIVFDYYKKNKSEN